MKPTNSWQDAIDAVKPYIFKIATPAGTGTGFLLSHTKTQILGIATAYHVVGHAHEWQQLIRVKHFSTGKEVVLSNDKRAIFVYPDKDLAFIMFPSIEKGLTLPSDDLSTISHTKRMRVGVEIGWCGFPYIQQDDLCFFNGHISCWIEGEKAYLVDGVAINGVSGGPAIQMNAEVMGVVSAYIPNKATGGNLPGVCVIRDVSPYKDELEVFKNFKEAEDKAEQQRAKQAQPAQPANNP